ncbi:UNVERIFIED_CONTAM: Retrovirus-related Pol polyprotein from transposon TNT 1-94 [Sesamum indicum]
MKKTPYSSAAGSLMHAMICTRPDITYVVGVVSRFLSRPKKEHKNSVKWISRYLKGTTKKCLCFGKRKLVLEGYTNVDLAGDNNSRKSRSGYLTTSGGGVVSWQYNATTEACKEMLWLKIFLL